MDEEGVEMITEWPVVDAGSSSARHQCVADRISSTSESTATRKRQHSLLSAGDMTTESCRNSTQEDTTRNSVGLHRHGNTDRRMDQSIACSDLGDAESDIFRKAKVCKTTKSESNVVSEDCAELYVLADRASGLSGRGESADRESAQSLDGGQEEGGSGPGESAPPARVQTSASQSESQRPELLAQTRIARWWRREGRQLLNFEQRDSTVGLPDSSNPNTVLYHVARLPQGRAFLEKEKQELGRRLQAGELSGEGLAALGSLEDWLDLPEEAASHMRQALQSQPHSKEWRWMLHKLQRQLRVKEEQSRLMPVMAAIPLSLSFPKAQQVARVSCRELDYQTFMEKYAMGRRPVIITDMVGAMTTVPWTLQHIREVAGDCEVKVKRSVDGSVEWAGLEEGQTVKVSQFLDDLDRCRDYLFDWSLPLHCPRLAEELTIPRYFAGDFLKRSSPGSLYRDSWPSLFVAPPGVKSGLHVDAFASNFWMALFQGRKRWVFFKAEDGPCLYPVYAHSLDPFFEVKVDEPDLQTHPLLSLVHPMECTLEAGELLFVPGGCPHCVENLDVTLAISGNFVDASNLTAVLGELDASGCLDPRAADLAAQLRDPAFPCATDHRATDLPWAQFKS